MTAGGRQLSRFNVISLALGLAFLYLPIVILVIYSFNASRLVQCGAAGRCAGTANFSTIAPCWMRPG